MKLKESPRSKRSGLRNSEWVYNATFGGQRLVTHVGADTTNASWSTSTMNFGNYVNNSVFGYTGKLQEMIFFNTDQSANRVTIEDNINNHFNIY